MSGDPRRILLVEDEAAIRDAEVAYLESAGFAVTSAEDGRKAVEAFGKGPFDVVVLDLMLPVLSGEEVCRRIRANSDVPIIMVTAKGEVEDRIIGLELGADDYLVKPFSMRELIARIKALLRRSRTEDEAQRETATYGDLVIDLAGHKVFVRDE